MAVLLLAGCAPAPAEASNDGVEIIAEAPAGSLAAPVLYPAGVLTATEHRAAAELFLAFLQSSEAIAVFESYGFAAAN